MFSTRFCTSFRSISLVVTITVSKVFISYVLASHRSIWGCDNQTNHCKQRNSSITRLMFSYRNLVRSNYISYGLPLAVVVFFTSLVLLIPTDVLYFISEYSRKVKYPVELFEFGRAKMVRIICLKI